MSVDLDNKWTYMKMHGIEGWDEYSSYLDIAVPRMLEIFEQRSVSGTVFIIGQDARLERNHPYLKQILVAGHEVGNHSYQHDTWMHTGTIEEIQHEIAEAEAAIVMATGARPRGFRAPGYGLSNASIAALVRMEYLYDASSFPNMLGPLAQMFFNATSRMSKEERARRKNTFGTFGNALKSLKPYFWIEPGSGDRLLELPVTSMPIFRTPIHLTYLLYLSRYSTKTAITYFRLAIALCRLRGVEPSLILHPPDFLGQDDNLGMEFFPGMDLPAATKITFVNTVLEILEQHYKIVPLGAHVTSICASPELKLKTRQITVPKSASATSLPEGVK